MLKCLAPVIFLIILCLAAAKPIHAQNALDCGGDSKDKSGFLISVESDRSPSVHEAIKVQLLSFPSYTYQHLGAPETGSDYRDRGVKRPGLQQYANVSFQSPQKPHGIATDNIDGHRVGASLHIKRFCNYSYKQAVVCT